MGKDGAVTRAKDESWTFQCPGVDGDPCGDQGTGQPFVSSGWPTKKTAEARGAQHLASHEDGDVMASLEEFRAEHDLTSHSDGVRAVKIGD